MEDNRSGELLILSDPFGSSTVFLYKTELTTLISSSLVSLTSLAKSDGKPLKKSLKYAAMLASSNNGGLVDSPYEGVRVLGQFKYISISTAGVSEKEYSIQDDIFSIDLFRPQSAELLRERVKQDIVANISAASRYPSSRYICHLTGGMDSRTVLAGLISSGYENKYVLHCGGDPLADDMQISRRLASAFDLQISYDSGLEVGVLSGSPVVDSKWSMHETAGLLRGPANPGLRQSDAVVLSGGFGGLLRNSFGLPLATVPSDGFDARCLMKPMLGALGEQDGHGNSVLNGELRIHALERLSQVQERAKTLGVPNEALPEFVWFSFRSRYYVGEISRSLSKYVNRFDPLYSPWMLALAWSYSRQERALNFAHLDLIVDIHEELAMMPYDKERITSAYLDARPNLTMGALPQSQAPMKRNSLAAAPFNLGLGNTAISSEQFESARKIGLPPATVAYSELYRSRCLEFIEELGKEELSQYFNFEHLYKLVANPPKWRPQYRSIRDLHDVLSWYLDE
ncbi:hypothetical protein [Glutamicibacter creatinolyticus]|uniref:hypothetical protein n=1 Tax=Glutamicibacter creatinolyticus TaxID=162496 RepID=UPI001110BA38|nr:hypothetical protein [Glutamicibacter creatinolyticus]